MRNEKKFGHLRMKVAKVIELIEATIGKNSNSAGAKQKRDPDDPRNPW